MSNAVKTFGRSLKDYFGQMGHPRQGALIALVVAVGLGVGVDFCGDFWIRHAFTAGLISGGALLVVTVLLVDEYFKFQERRKWDTVAAFALEDLGRVARALWVHISGFIVPQLGNVRVAAFRHQIESREGRRQLEEQLLDITSQPHRRRDLHERLYASAERTRALLISWSPVLVGVGPLAERLSAFSDLHRQLVQVLRLLSVEQSGFQLPATPEDIADKILAINDRAISLDRKFFTDATDLAPLVQDVDLD